MPIDNADISIVMQGGLQGGFDARYSRDYLRTVFPGSPIVLATQNSQVDRALDLSGFDDVVLTPDPGALPSLRFRGEPNNINRQIVSTAAGLQAVTTPYAIKMRTDAYLSSRRCVEYWSALADVNPGPRKKATSRILTVTFFTCNPRFDERSSYNVSDWFQFGRTEDLRKFWNCPEFDFSLGTFYEVHAHPSGSLWRERLLRSKYASEQWLTLNYLFGAGPYPISCYNDCSPEIMDVFEEDLIDNFVVVHPYDIDFSLPKHKGAFGSKYANMRNYSFEDWKQIAESKRGIGTEMTGYSTWPRTPSEKAFYLVLRNAGSLKSLRRR